MTQMVRTLAADEPRVGVTVQARKVSLPTHRRHLLVPIYRRFLPRPSIRQRGLALRLAKLPRPVHAVTVAHAHYVYLRIGDHPDNEM